MPFFHISLGFSGYCSDKRFGSRRANNQQHLTSFLISPHLFENIPRTHISDFIHRVSFCTIYNARIWHFFRLIFELKPFYDNLLFGRWKPMHMTPFVLAIRAILLHSICHLVTISTGISIFFLCAIDWMHAKIGCKKLHENRKNQPDMRQTREKNRVIFLSCELHSEYNIISGFLNITILLFRSFIMQEQTYFGCMHSLHVLTFAA